MFRDREADAWEIEVSRKILAYDKENNALAARLAAAEERERRLRDALKSVEVALGQCRCGCEACGYAESQLGAALATPAASEGEGKKP